MFSKNKFTLLLLALTLTACISTLYMPTENDAVKNNISLDTLQAGRLLYINSCGSCHNLYLPESYSYQEWLQIMNKMQSPAKIDNNQKNLINQYLNVHAKN